MCLQFFVMETNSVLIQGLILIQKQKVDINGEKGAQISIVDTRLIQNYDYEVRQAIYYTCSLFSCHYVYLC